MGRGEGKKKGNVKLFFTKMSEVNRVSLTSILKKSVKSVCHLSSAYSSSYVWVCKCECYVSLTSIVCHKNYRIKKKVTHSLSHSVTRAPI